jgi:thioesterase domain-containing protein
MITRAQGAALTSLVVVDSTAKTPGRVEIKLAEKRQAAMDLAKLLGYVQDRVKLEGSLDLVARTAKIAEDVRAMTDEELAEYDALERQQEALLARAHTRYQARALPVHIETVESPEPAPELVERVDGVVTVTAEQNEDAGL